ncbi:MAG TPA: hypothetical protein VMV35_10860 [Halothiobacillus sp.]|nr:hypothetical protein [Halothiobacillus sp.]
MNKYPSIRFYSFTSNRHSKELVRDVTWIAGSALVACALFAGLASAAPVPRTGDHMGNKSLIVPLTDPELSVMRGKFLPNNQQVVFFGVEMVSQWQTAGGTMNAGMTLGIDRSRGAPTVSYQPTVTIMGAPTQIAANGVVQDGSAQDTRGVRQQIQVAGNDNQATNQFQVAVIPYASGGDSTPAGNGQQQVSLSHGGATVTAGISGGNQAGVTIQLGNSTVRQVIGGGSNALQLIQLAGNQQSIQNQLRLVVGVNQAAGLAGVDLKRQVGMALATMRGM